MNINLVTSRYIIVFPAWKKMSNLIPMLRIIDNTECPLFSETVKNIKLFFSIFLSYQISPLKSKPGILKNNDVAYGKF